MAVRPAGNGPPTVLEAADTARSQSCPNACVSPTLKLRPVAHAIGCWSGRLLVNGAAVGKGTALESGQRFGSEASVDEADVDYQQAAAAVTEADTSQFTSRPPTLLPPCARLVHLVPPRRRLPAPAVVRSIALEASLAGR